jgi:hypothetical protein
MAPCAQITPRGCSSVRQLRTQDFSQLLAQDRHVVCCGLPNEWSVDPEVLVNQDVSQPDNVGPRYRTVPRPNLRA